MLWAQMVEECGGRSAGSLDSVGHCLMNAFIHCGIGLQPDYAWQDNFERAQYYARCTTAWRIFGFTALFYQ